MQRPTTPSIQVDDTAQSATQSQASPQSNPRPRSTASIGNADDEPWRRPSIRIRRLPSNQTVQRTRAASIATAVPREPQRTGSNVEYRGVRHLSVAAGPGADPPTPGSDGHLTVEPPSSSATRPRSGSGSIRHLRHENRSLDSPVPGVDGGRRRSSSDPPQMHWETLPGARGSQRISAYMPPLEEGTATSTQAQAPASQVLSPGSQNVGEVDQSSDHPGYFGVGRRLSNAAGQTYSRFFPTLNTVDSQQADSQEEQYESDIVDVLDTIDPEVSTLNTLTNVQNSLFVPDLGRYLNRRPTYTLTRRGTGATRAPTIIEDPVIEAAAEEIFDEGEAMRPQRTYTLTSMTSRLDDSHFAVLPHGERLEGWTAEDRAELNDHVRHLLHSRKEKFKRSMKGFGQYLRKPLGFFVTLYATLITLFGLAWVLFLIGWINLGGRKDYIVNVIDNVLVALFAVIGDGLAPFRTVDTYHMCFIAHYHHLTWRLRREQSLPKLQNRNDLPGLGPSWDTRTDVELELGEKQTEHSVLNPKQQKRLIHHQKKFSRSHTFYKPHETATHFAFPLRLLVAVVVLLDCHSLLQIALGTCTWAISYHRRPFALTTVILCCSITCNITAGVLISVGDHKTRKKDVLERMFRQQLTSQAIHRLEKRKQKERQTLSMDVSRADLTASGSETIYEKEEKAVAATGVNGGDVESWSSAQDHQPKTRSQPNNTSITTTTVTGPTIKTTTSTT